MLGAVVPHRHIAAAKMCSTGVTVHPAQEWLHAGKGAGGEGMTVATESAATREDSASQWAKVFFLRLESGRQNLMWPFVKERPR
jgi:hypothetical protein